MVLGIPETDPLPEDANVNYIGPILWQKPESKLPDWIRNLRDDTPVVWLYTGNPSYGPIAPWADSAVVLDICIKALADENMQVVLTTGHHALPKELSALPANFRYEPFVPGLAMAQKSDLLMHHGGYGSCQTGLYTGTPSVIIPTYSERESNARRIAAVGAGDFVVPPRHGSDKRQIQAVTEEVRGKVRQVVSELSFAASAMRIADKMRGYGGANYAADLIQELRP